MKNIFAALYAGLCLAACAAGVPQDALYKIDATLSGAKALPRAGDELEDVPVLLRIPSGVAAKSSHEGRDFAIFDADGTQLPYEVASWSADGGEVWVKVPKLAPDANLAIYFGGAAQEDTSAQVWSGCLARVAEGSEPVRVADVNGSLKATKEGVFTVSGWFKANESLNYSTYPRIFARNGSFQVEIDPYNGGYGYIVYPGSTDYGDHIKADKLPDIKADWVKFDFVYTTGESQYPTDIIAYVNGVYIRVFGVPELAANSTGDFWAGANGSGGDAFDGSFKEVRYMDGELSADRIAADYAIMTDEDFVTFGEIQKIAQVVKDFDKSVTFTVAGDVAVEGSFAVPVRISEAAIEGFYYSDCADLVFADANGSILAHEIETWDATGESVVWVALDGCAKGDKFTMYYGTSVSGELLAPATSLWDGYAAVWHMNGETGGTETDSANGLVASPYGSATGDMTSEIGVAGAAKNNASGNRLVVPSADELQLDGNFTASGYFNASDIDGWPRFFSHRNLETKDGWLVQMGEGKIYAHTNGSSDYSIKSVDFPVGDWVHLAFVYDGVWISIFVDGERVHKGEVKTAAASPNAEFVIGGDNNPGEGKFHGLMDEIRIEKRALSDEKVKAQYLSMQSGFLSAGAVRDVFYPLIIIIR
ncbi:MAG: DUF2341 domain-containing protein [Kiritimatiellae bacterium]|nr:DUF2341 domain-containing protein [Kiritimatiellia bacterium]